MIGTLPVVDHLVYGAPDLELGMARIESLLGVMPVEGGRHPEWGTRNALVSLGGDRYLEVIAPDPERMDRTKPVLFDLGELPEPRLVTWAAKAVDLLTMVARVPRIEVLLGPILDGRRERPDGTELRWRLTDPVRGREEGVLPFLIDWLDTPHPGPTAPAGCVLEAFRLVHPVPDRLMSTLEKLGLEVEVGVGHRARLEASLQTPRGRVELAS